jgi:hypothetical protein
MFLCKVGGFGNTVNYVSADTRIGKGQVMRQA